MKIIRQALVGTGYFGVALARAIQSLEDAKIVAVLEHRDNQKIAEEFGCETEKNLDALYSIQTFEEFCFCAVLQ